MDSLYHPLSESRVGFYHNYSKSSLCWYKVNTEIDICWFLTTVRKLLSQYAECVQCVISFRGENMSRKTDIRYIILFNQMRMSKYSFWNSYTHTKTCMWMFIASVFTSAKTWMQPRCPFSKWRGKLIVLKPDKFSTKKQWGIKLWKDTEESYMHTTKWRKLICTISAVWYSGKHRTTENTKAQ